MATKRSLDSDDSDSAAPVAKRTRLDCVYVLTRTDHVDDYGDPSNVSVTSHLGIFASKYAARAALENDKLACVLDRMRDHELYDGEYARYCKSGPDEDGAVIFDEDAVRDNLDVLVEAVLEGEYVNNLYDWHMTKQPIVY